MHLAPVEDLNIMKKGQQRGHGRRRGPELNTADYRSDFGPEGMERFERGRQGDRPAPRHHRGPSDAPHWDDRRQDTTAGDWRWQHSDRDGWNRARGYGHGLDVWGAAQGFRPAGFGFGPEEGPGPGGIRDRDWQVTRPARGRDSWAGDWEEADRETRERQHDFRGLGPRGYRRADDRIRDEVCERLTDDWSVDASDITVQVADGEVTLTGVVDSRLQKRKAAECAEQVNGVQDVMNQLRLRTGPQDA